MDYTYLYRLREIVRRLKSGQVDKTTLVDNLEYAADVLENVYKVETLYGNFFCPLFLCTEQYLYFATQRLPTSRFINLGINVGLHPS